MAKDKEKSKKSGGVRMKSIFSKLVKTLKKDKRGKEPKAVAVVGAAVWWVRASGFRGGFVCADQGGICANNLVPISKPHLHNQ